MSSKIQIICTKPGMRRNGIEHPASAIYAANHWSEDELKAFAADPSFIVQPVSSGGVQVESEDIEAAVVARVEVAKAALQVDFDAAKEKLQADFARTVKEAVDDKLDAAKAEATKDVQAKLTTAEGKVAELTKAVTDLSAALEEAKSKTTPKK